ncbi:MAG TPA: metallopeptidase TldD-related protein [Burkholderiales bacterium]|nr:metallopeptidase TldD-related protein [Burkholderiales bacterium]
MKSQFYELAARLERELAPGEALLCNLSAERSDFVRFNQARVRQAGSVEQRYLNLRLVRARRQASATIALAGDGDDAALARHTLARLREGLAELPEDPWLLINEAPQSSESERRGALAPAPAVMEQAMSAAAGRDLVGFYAGGTIYRGFANSRGQRNWHEVDSYNFDWSLYRQAEQATSERRDQAVKTSYAGFDWDATAFAARMAQAAEQLELLALPRRTLEPGEYRAYLAPRALAEVLGLLCWGGFSARARQTKQSPLMRMEEGRALAAQITLAENIAEGVAPAFQAEGFVRPAVVPLISAGKLGDPLVSPRSAKEYSLATNAANSGESPESLDMAAGRLAERDVLQALDTGLYISNLWYLNFSDRPAGRITGMTRFATFWVDGGRIVAPLTPMRFDESVYRLLGETLVDVTRERELLPDSSTYGERQTSSVRLPGALVSALRFTL